MNFKKRICTAVLAVMMVFSLSACSGGDTGWIAQYKGEKVAAGVYLLNQLNAYGEAQEKITDSEKGLWKSEIDGKDTSTWINDRAMELFKQNLIVLDQFDAMGLTLTEDDTKSLDAYVEQAWYQYGEAYTKNGVSKESLRYLNEITLKSNKVFEKLYGEGGEKAVTTEELKAEYNKQYVKTTYMVLSLMIGDKEMTDAEKEIMRTKANGYLDRLKKGEDFYTIIKEYENEILIEGDKIHCETAGEKAHDVLDNVNNSIFPDGFHTEIAKYNIGDAFMMEEKTGILLAQKLDPNADPTNFENAKLNLLYSMKSEDFKAYLSTLQPAGELTINDAAVKRYDPKNLEKNSK